MDRSASNTRLVFHNGQILTLTRDQPRASIAVVERGRILEVRSPGAPLPEPVAGETRFDLKGHTLLPSFADAHTHLIHWGLQFSRPDLSACRSLEEALERVAERHRAAPAGRPLIAEGWDESRWVNPRAPTRRELDSLSTDRPLVLRRVCGHLAVANGKALERIPDGPGVDRSSGVLLEEAAMGLARAFPPSEEELDEALRAAQKSYLGLGITAVHDMSTPEHLKTYARAERRGELLLNVTCILTRPHLTTLADSGLAAGWSRDHLRVWGVKLFSDGSLGARTAALHDPYEDRKDERGTVLFEAGELVDLIRTAESNGIPVAVHAIGDRAVDFVLSSFEDALAGQMSSLGHRIEHLEMVGAGGVERMKRLGLVASMQPNFIRNWGLPGGMYEARLGPQRVRAMNPLKDVVEAGVPLALGSDAMPAGALLGLAAATEAPYESQRLTRLQALEAATRGGAFAAGDPHAGGIAPGGKADFVILDGDPLTAKSLMELRVVETIAAGKLVSSSPASPSPVAG